MQFQPNGGGSGGSDDDDSLASRFVDRVRDRARDAVEEDEETGQVRPSPSPEPSPDPEPDDDEPETGQQRVQRRVGQARDEMARIGATVGSAVGTAREFDRVTAEEAGTLRQAVREGRGSLDTAVDEAESGARRVHEFDQRDREERDRLRREAADRFDDLDERDILVVGGPDERVPVRRDALAEMFGDPEMVDRFDERELDVVDQNGGAVIVPTERAVDRVTREQVAEQDDRLDPWDVELVQISPEEQERRQEIAEMMPEEDVPDTFTADREIQLTDDARDRFIREQVAEEAEGVDPSDIEIIEEDGQIQVELVEDVGHDRDGVTGWLADRSEEWQAGAEWLGDQTERVLPGGALITGTGQHLADLDDDRDLPRGRVDEATAGIVEGGVSISDPAGLALFAHDVGRGGIQELGMIGEARIDAAGELLDMGVSGVADDPTQAATEAAEVASPLPPRHTRDRVGAGVSAGADATAELVSGLQADFAADPYRTAGGVAGMAVGSVVIPTAAVRGAGALRRGVGRRTPSGGDWQPRILGDADRAQLDLTGPTTRQPQRRGEPVDPSDLDRVDPRVFERADQRPTGFIEDRPTRIAGRGPRQPTDDMPGFAQLIRGEEPTPTPRADASEEVVSGIISRREAAAAPSWLAAGAARQREGLFDVPPEGQFDIGQDMMVGFESAQIDAGLMGAPDATGMLDEAQRPAVTQRQEALPRAAQRADERAGIGQDIGQRPAQRQRVGVGLRTGMRTGLRTGITGLTTPRTPGHRPPPRQRRPPRIWPSPSLGFGEDPRDDSFSINVDVGFGEGDLGPGWIGETITDIGTMGAEAPRAPDADVLATDPGRVTGALPTAQMLEGDEDVDAALDLFSPGVGSSGDGGDDWDLDFEFDDFGGGDRNDDWRFF